MPLSKIELSNFWQRITKFHDSGAALADPSGQRGIYDRFSSPDEMERLFDEKELELTVGSFTNLARVIIVYPFSSWDARPMSRKDKEGRTYLEYPVANGELERCVIWKSIMVDHQSVIEPVINCLTNSSAHFVKLFHENL